MAGTAVAKTADATINVAGTSPVPTFHATTPTRERRARRVGRTVRVNDADIYYEYVGDGPALLIIGGAAAGCFAFAKMASFLANSFRVISYDRRGTLRSSGRTECNLDVAQESFDIVAILNDVKVQNAAIFATCAGASVGFDLTARYPQYVSTLIAHEPVTIGVLDDVAEQRDFVQHIYRVNDLEGPSAGLATWMRSIGHDVGPTLRPESRARMNDYGDFVFRYQVVPLVEFMPDVAAIKRSGARVGVAVGEKSRIGGYPCARTVPALAHMLGCDVFAFPGHHNSYMSQPEAFAETLRAAVHLLSPIT